jgi:hypothetical protein
LHQASNELFDGQPHLQCVLNLKELFRGSLAQTILELEFDQRHAIMMRPHIKFGWETQSSLRRESIKRFGRQAVDGKRWFNAANGHFSLRWPDNIQITA